MSAGFARRRMAAQMSRTGAATLHTRPFSGATRAHGTHSLGLRKGPVVAALLCGGVVRGRAGKSGR